MLVSYSYSDVGSNSLNEKIINKKQVVSKTNIEQKLIIVIDNNINTTLSRAWSGFNIDSQKVLNKDLYYCIDECIDEFMGLFLHSNKDFTSFWTIKKFVWVFVPWEK